ncbi:MAG: V-type ATP synthase subunit B, partial [Methanosphaera sp.]
MNDVDIKTREYTTVSEVSGPLMVVQGVEGAAYNEIVEIETPAGEKRTGQVLEVENDIAVVQVFEGTSNLNTESTKVRFTGETAKIGLSTDMLGRIFNGIGTPIDGGPDIIPDVELDVNGSP